MPASSSHQSLEKRYLRSYVRRDGRITKGQQKAINTFWEYYGIDLKSGQVLDFEVIFQRKAPVWLEIGFGNGEALIAMARALPEINFLGIDVYRAGVGQLLRLIAANELLNIRVVCDDALQLLNHHITPQSLARVLLFFPDPWPKKRHHKRRLVRSDFVRLIYTVLRPGGFFHMVTDWEDYALHALQVMAKEGDFMNMAGRDGFAERPHYRPTTKFEQRGRRLGHGVWDLLFRRC